MLRNCVWIFFGDESRTTDALKALISNERRSFRGFRQSILKNLDLYMHFSLEGRSGIFMRVYNGLKLKRIHCQFC